MSHVSISWCLRVIAILIASQIAIGASASAQTIFINEVDADQTSIDTAEFVELYDGGVGNTALDGLVLVLYNGAIDQSYNAFDLDGLSTDAGGFFVLCGDAANVPNCDLDVIPNSNLIQNGADGVALYLGDATDFPIGTAVTTTNLIDAIVYDTNDADAVGLLVLLNPGQPQVNEAGGGDAGIDSNSRVPDGGVLRNTDTYVQQTPTPGATNVVIATGVIINEVDADQTGIDAAEFVELFDGGSGSTSLDGLVLVLYNGAIDQSYNAFDLDGLSTDADGFFVLCGDAANVPNCDLDVASSFPIIQNGADAVALYVGDATDFPPGSAVTTTNLIDAIVYGTNDADDVALLVLLNPGQPQVNEDGAGDKDNHSNSRVPDGGVQRNTDTYVQQAPTPGATNFVFMSSPVVINEVDADTPGSDAAEFVELYDGGVGNTSLTGLVVVFYNGFSDVSYRAFDLDGFTTDADGFFVLGNASVLNVDLVFPNNGLQNGADAVALYGGDASNFPNGTGVTTTNLIDAVVYDTNDGDDAGLLVLLNPGQQQLNEDGAGDRQNHSNSRIPDGGTPRNTDTYVQQPPTPGVTNIVPATEVVINEVDADTQGNDAAEFVELYVGGLGNRFLDGLVVVFYNGSNELSYNAFDLDGFTTDTDGFFVLGNPAVPNVDLVFPGNGLQNGADAVAVYLGNDTDFPSGTPVTTANLLDAIVYDTNDADDAGLLALLNPSQPQVNEGGAGDKDGHSNQRIPNGMGGQRNTATYMQLEPTPGTQNIGFAEIYEIQGSGLDSPFANTFASTSENVVTAVGTDGFYMQTPTARTDGDVNTSDGIFVFTGAPPTVAVGDLVNVVGEVIEFFGFTEFSFDHTLTVLGTGPVPAPVIFDAATPSPDPNAPSCSVNNLECFEGMLIEINGGSVSGPNQQFGSDPIAEVYIVAEPNRAFTEKGIVFPGMPPLPIWDGNPEVFELDPDKLGLPNLTIPGGSSFDATGVLGFEFGGYELWPSSLTVDPAPLPVTVPVREPGEATIASLNLFRLFDDVPAEYARRRAKFALYILDVLRAPEILAVQEAEKIEVLQQLAADIAAINPGVVYTAYLVEGNDVGGIDIGFLVRDNVQVDAVTQLGASETYIDPTDGSVDILHDRPPLLLEGAFRINGSPALPIAVLNVHNRSLNGIDNPTDGARVRQKRLEQAQSIAQKVQDYQTTGPNLGLSVVGDFNAFQFTDGYVDAVGQIRGDFNPAENLLFGPDLVNPDLTNQVSSLPEEEQYSFIFRGNAQVLDHILTSTALDPDVAGLAFGRGNADAAFNFRNDDATALRSSDHDGVVMYVVVNAPPEITSVDPRDQTVQYSDAIAPVAIIATDDDRTEPHSDLTFSSRWWEGAGTPALGLPPDLTISAASCSPATSGQQCSWTLNGQMLQPAGVYSIEVTVGDSQPLYSDPDTLTITVEPEATKIMFAAGNDGAVQVATEGGDSPPFDLTYMVHELDDPNNQSGDANLAGDIDLATSSLELVPVGPGPSVSGTCVEGTTVLLQDDPDSPPFPYDYYKRTITCSFAGVPVNTYAVEVTVNVDGYYQGENQSVVTVFDPSLGFTTGGGWFYWPSTTDTTNFGFNAKHTKKGNKTKGNVLIIRHLSDGTHYRLKSNAMHSLAVGNETVPTAFGWAVITGKATYKEPLGDPTGNHEFTAYVEDHGTPGGGADRFWVEVTDDGSPVTLSMLQTAQVNAVTIEKGNIVVPQGKGKGKASKFDEEIPEVFALHPSYPNPFNPSTTITLDVPEESEVGVRVYDILGRLVRVLADGSKSAGVHRIVFEAGTMPGGLYVIVAQTPKGRFVQKVMLIK